MGAGASTSAVPDIVDKATAKALAGETWDDAAEAQFDAAAAEGVVSKAQFEACARRCYGVGCAGCTAAPEKARTKTARVPSSITNDAIVTSEALEEGVGVASEATAETASIETGMEAMLVE